MKDRRAVAPLLEALKNPDPQIRNNAIYLLGQIDDPSTLEPIRAMLNATSADVHWVVIQALGDMKDSRAISLLLDLLRHPDEKLRGYAARTLGEKRERRAVLPGGRILGGCRS